MRTTTAALCAAGLLLIGWVGLRDLGDDAGTDDAGPPRPPFSIAQRPSFGDQWSRQKLKSAFALIDTNEILAGGPPKDGIAALTNPRTVGAADAGYMRANDRVIGVEIGGEARAYPLRILVWHENANDTLGGKPIAVSYCPLCDSAIVFDREIDGHVREFGISGKLYRSNVLFFDRQTNAEDESLWSQLQMKAVVGPAAKAGLKLQLLDAELTTWADWLERHPTTTVLSKNTGHGRNYDVPAYADYFATDGIGFGAHGKPKRRPDLKNKDPIVVVEAGGERRIYIVRDVAKAAGGDRTIEDTLGGVKLRLTYLAEAESLRVEATGGDSGGETPTIHPVYTFWFAWEGLFPGVEIWEP